jgi:tetratricopeptide (TPR) repeat protein
VTVPADDAEAVRALAQRWDAAVESGDASTLLRVAVALARADRPAAAATVARDALSVAANDPRTYQVAAWLERRVGDASAARRTAALVRRYLAVIDEPDRLDRELAEAEDRGDVAALIELAERHREHERVRTALDIALEALRLAPRDREVHLSIARSHLALGQRALAIDEVARLVRLAELDGDTAGMAHIAELVNDHLVPGSLADPV